VRTGANSWVDISRPNRKNYRASLVTTVAVVVFFALLAVSAYQGLLVDRWANQTDEVVAALAIIEIIVLWTFAARWTDPIARDPPTALTVKGRIVELRLRSGRISRLNLETVAVQSWADAANKPARMTISTQGQSRGWLRLLGPADCFELTPEAFEAIQSAARTSGLRMNSTPLKDLAKRGERIQFAP
jgi:hypothetical protein